MIPVRVREDGPVVGSVTKLIVDNKGITVYIELDEEGKYLQSASSIISLRSLSFNPEEG